MRLMTAFILCCMLLLTVNLWRLQVTSGEDYRVRQENQSVRAVRLPATRGRILDCNQQPLAVNRLRFDVHMYIDELRPLFYTHYMRLKDGRKLRRAEQDELGRTARYQVVSNLTMQVSLRLGQPLVLNEEKFHTHYYKRRYTPMAVMQDLSPGQVARFVEQIHAVPGVDLSVNPVRTYPNGDMAFHTLGYLRRDDDPDTGDDIPFRFRYRLAGLCRRRWFGGCIRRAVARGGRGQDDSRQQHKLPHERGGQGMAGVGLRHGAYPRP